MVYWEWLLGGFEGPHICMMPRTALHYHLASRPEQFRSAATFAAGNLLVHSKRPRGPPLDPVALQDAPHVRVHFHDPYSLQLTAFSIA